MEIGRLPDQVAKAALREVALHPAFQPPQEVVDDAPGDDPAHEDHHGVGDQVGGEAGPELIPQVVTGAEAVQHVGDDQRRKDRVDQHRQWCGQQTAHDQPGISPGRAPVKPQDPGYRYRPAW